MSTQNIIISHQNRAIEKNKMKKQKLLKIFCFVEFFKKAV